MSRFSRSLLTVFMILGLTVALSSPSFACWCTGSNQCPGGWNWGGGENYCVAGLRCCSQGAPAPAPAPAQTTTTTTSSSTYTNKNSNNNVYVAGLGWLSPERAAELDRQRQAAGLSQLVVDQYGGASAASVTKPTENTVTVTQYAQTTPTGTGPAFNCYSYDAACVQNTLATETKAVSTGQRLNDATVTVQTTSGTVAKLTWSGGVVDPTSTSPTAVTDPATGAVVGSNLLNAINNVASTTGSSETPFVKIETVQTGGGTFRLQQGEVSSEADFGVLSSVRANSVQRVCGVRQCTAADNCSSGATYIQEDPNADSCVGSQIYGGCGYILACDCNSDGTNDKFQCTNTTTGSQAGERCSSSVCTSVGSTVTVNGQTLPKICEPGQVYNCNYTTNKGDVCNDYGTGYIYGANAHACGYVGSQVYIADGSGGVSGRFTGTAGVQLINQDGSLKTGENAVLNLQGGYSYAGGFIGCGGSRPEISQYPSSYNCYLNGNTYTCKNEPGLSCGANTQTPTSTTTQTLERAVTTVTTTTTTTTSTPTAVCGQPCGASAGGATCTGTSMACVDGTCRSTLCSATEQDSQCICQETPIAPMCIDIKSSKANPQIGDEVNFTCAPVENAERYEFRFARVHFNAENATAELFNTAIVTTIDPATPGSNTSKNIVVDKVGRYIAQCRPCAGNNLCQQWEPLSGQIGPAKTEFTRVPAPTPTPDQTQQLNTTETTSTSTDSGAVSPRSLDEGIRLTFPSPDPSLTTPSSSEGGMLGN